MGDGAVRSSALFLKGFWVLKMLPTANNPGHTHPGEIQYVPRKTSVGLAAPDLSHDIQGTATWESPLSWMARKTATTQVSHNLPRKPADQRFEAASTNCWQARVRASREKPGTEWAPGVHEPTPVLHLPFLPSENSTQFQGPPLW